MVPRVIADGMPCLGHLPHQFWILLCQLTQHEEGCMNLVLLQNIKQGRGRLWVWPVVKCERSDSFPRGDMRETSQHPFLYKS
jgi:hypothetical protein